MRWRENCVLIAPRTEAIDVGSLFLFDLVFFICFADLWTRKIRSVSSDLMANIPFDLPTANEQAALTLFQQIFISWEFFVRATRINVLIITTLQRLRTETLFVYMSLPYWIESRNISTSIFILYWTVRNTKLAYSPRTGTLSFPLRTPKQQRSSEQR